MQRAGGKPAAGGHRPTLVHNAGMLLALLAAPTILVAPFAVHGDGIGWAGVAVAESVTDVVVQANRENFITMKQLDAVLRRRDLKLDEAAVPPRANEVARALGATDLIVGDVTVQGDGFALEARRVRLKDGVVLVTAREEGTRAQLPVLAQKLGRAVLADTGTLGPMTRSVQALELATRCELGLVRQQLGARARVSLTPEQAAQAEKDCRAALKADPALGLAHAGLAVALAVRGKLPQARKEAQAASSARFVPLASLADAFAAHQLHDTAAARGVLHDAVEERPGFLHALGYMAEDHIDKGEDKEALEVLDRYLARAPDHPWALGKKARELARLKQFDEAVEVSEKALGLDPGDPELLIETASRYIDAGRDARAEPLLQQAAHADPPRPLALLRLGYLYFRGHKLKEARAALDQCIVEARRDDETRTRGIAHTDLARIDAKQNKYAEAVEELGKARKEGFNRLPCDEPELARWKERPELARTCAEAAAALSDEKSDESAVPVELSGPGG